MATASASRGRRRRQPAQKREQIIGAASRLFVDHGFESTTTAGIAEAAGVSDGALFHHFPTKADLLAACGARCADELAGAIAAARALPGAPNFGQMFSALFAWAERKPALVHMMRVAADASPSSATEGPRGVVVDAVAGNLAHWSAQGFLRPMEPRIVAVLMSAMIETALAEAFVFGGERDRDRCLDALVACVERATAPEREERSP